MVIPNRVALPEPVSGYELSEKGFWGVIVPEATTNLFTNPSIELVTTGYTPLGSTLARSATEQTFGSYSLRMALIAPYGGCYATAGLISGTTYTFSLYLKGQAGGVYRISFINNTTGNAIVEQEFSATGLWQRAWVTYTETASLTRRLAFRQMWDDPAGIPPSYYTYLDGWQLEAKSYLTDYCDGDQDGCYWVGYPHGSASCRPAAYRGGGRAKSLRDLGFRVSSYVGASAAPVRVIANEYGSLDGAYYQKTVVSPGVLTLAGRFYGESLAYVQAAKRRFWNAVKPDLVLPTQPATLTYQLLDDCGNAAGEELRAEAAYSAGYEGSTDNLNQEQTAVSFVLPDPCWRAAASQGMPLDWSDSLTVYYAMAKMNGAWSALGLTAPAPGTGTVYAAAIGPDGCVYIGGNFINWAGIPAADYVAKYDPYTATWSALGAPGEAAGREVRAIAVTPTGDVYVGGKFENWAGNGDCDQIAMWDVSASTWVPVGTGCQGVSCTVDALAYYGPYLFVGGSFTSAGSVANTAFLALWDGAWHSLGVVNHAVNAIVGSVEQAKLWVGGNFTSIVKGGITTTCNFVAEFNGNAGTWAALANGANVGMNSTVFALTLDQQGNLYAGGNFTTSGGVTTNYIAKWNGTSWSALGSGLNAGVLSLAIGPDGVVYAGGTFSTAGGVSVYCIARWINGCWLPMSFTFAGYYHVYAIAISGNGNIVLGFDDTGNVSVAGSTTADNTGTAATSPLFRFRGPCRVVSIRNETTGEEIGFNLTLSASEYAVLDLRPGHLRFECYLLESRTPDVTLDDPYRRFPFGGSYPGPAGSMPILRGSIMKTILPGSSLSTFRLVPGSNVVTAFMDGTTADTILTMEWRRRFWGVEGGVGLATE